MPLGIEQITRAVARRTRRGLYAGRQVLSGNKISEDGGNKTRRMWKPNAQSKHLYSEVLQRMVPVRVTTHALRCITKAGGLDAYVLNTPDRKMQSDFGAALRLEMQQALAQRAAAERMGVIGGASAGAGGSAPAAAAAAVEGTAAGGVATG